MRDDLAGVFLRCDDHFKFETSSGRKGAGVVLAIEFEQAAPAKYFVRWFDVNGKHYEWFELSEFSNIDLMTKEQFDVYVKQ